MVTRRPARVDDPGPRREAALRRPDVVLRATVTGAGPTVLLVHAGGERRRVWEPVGDLLAARGLRAIAYDLRGHGESGGSATSLPVIAADVAAMIDHEQAPLVVVGASLGGLAALAALADPVRGRRAAGLVLVDTVPEPDPVGVRRWLGRRGLRDAHAELVDDILDRGRELRVAATAIPSPIHLARGRRSPLAEVGVARLLAVRPDLTVSWVPGVGHLVAREAPEQLGRVVADRARAWLDVRPR